MLLLILGICFYVGSLLAHGDIFSSTGQWSWEDFAAGRIVVGRAEASGSLLASAQEEHWEEKGFCSVIDDRDVYFSWKYLVWQLSWLWISWGQLDGRCYVSTMSSSTYLHDNKKWQYTDALWMFPCWCPALIVTSVTHQCLCTVPYEDSCGMCFLGCFHVSVIPTGTCGPY